MQSPQEVIRHVAGGNDLTQDEAAVVMEGIMTGMWTDSQIGAYLTALHMKGETMAELTGSAYVMRSKAFHLEVANRPLLDIVGSGGDGLHTLNVSTLSGIVAAGAGAFVAKHGNRAMTGMCGSADILEGLGVTLEISPADAIRGIDANHFAFLMAPHFHQSMKYAIGPRKEIGVPSIFNHLGPLTNPVQAENYLLGVNSERNTQRFTEVLAGLGCKHSLVVHGEDGMDEITLTGKTVVVENKGGNISRFEITPEDFGMERVDIGVLKMEDRAASIKVARSVLFGQGLPAHENLICLNAGAGLYAAGLAADIASGVEMARDSIQSGKARKVLEQIIVYTQERRQSE